MNAIIPTTATSATPETEPAATPAEPTAAQVHALIAAGHVRSALPPKPGHRPRGRPRKDGQPPRQTDSGRNAAAIATAAARHIATNPLQHIGTEEHRRAALLKACKEGTEAPSKYADNALLQRVRNLRMTQSEGRARTFLEALANVGYKEACKAAAASPCVIQSWRNNNEFAEIYAEIMKAHEAAIIAKTCDTLQTLANGEYKPRPDCLPPDMRAASLLMPAIDPRFRPNSQTAAQQVQINISI